MALTTEVIEKLDVTSVLKAIEDKRKAEAALTAQSTKLGVSEKELAKVLRDQQNALKPSKFTALTDAVERSTVATGAMTAATGNLRSQLIDIGVGLQGGQNPFTVLSQQLPQIAEAAVGTTGALGAFATQLGTVASVGTTVLLPFLSVAGPLWLDYAAAQKRATEEAEAWATIQEGQKPLLDRAQADLKALTELTRGAETLDETKNRLAQEYGEQLEQTNAPLKERIALLKRETDLNKEGQTITGVNYEDNRKELAALNAELAENNRQAAAGLVSALQVAEYEAEAAESARVLAERKEQEAKARKKGNEVKKDEIDLFAELIKKEDEMAEQERELTEARNKWLKQGVEDWVKGVEDRRQAEIRAAEDAANAWRSFTSGTQTMIGNLATFAGDAAEKIGETNEKAALKAFRVQQAAQVIEATISAVRIGEEFAAAAAKINPLLAFPAGAAGFAAAEAAYVMPIAQQEPPSFNDTPRMQQAGPHGATVNFAPGDIIGAARRPSDFAQQVGGSGGGNVSTTVKFTVNGRTAQAITTHAKRTRRGVDPGAPVAGHRKTRY